MPRNRCKALTLTTISLFIFLSVSMFLCSLFLSLSHTHTHAYINIGQIGSAQSEQKMKARGSCVHASGAVWVGKWWKRGSFSKLTAPLRILHLPHHERPESFSTRSYSHPAWRNCHIPENTNNDNVSILVLIYFSLGSAASFSLHALWMSVQDIPGLILWYKLI